MAPDQDPSNEQNRVIDYAVTDEQGHKIGNLESLWMSEDTGDLEYVGVKTGWLSGKAHVIPASEIRVDDEAGVVRVPYDKDHIKHAPAYGPSEDLSADREQEIRDYYGLEAPSGAPPVRAPEEELAEAEGFEELEIPLAEEELRVGKREVSAGETHLRKVVRTEHVEEPVDLRRQELEIEREPASGEAVPEDAFQEREYTIRETREEPVVEREAHLRESVHARSHEEVEHREVGGDVRREELEVDREPEEGRAAGRRPRGGPEGP